MGSGRGGDAADAAAAGVDGLSLQNKANGEQAAADGKGWNEMVGEKSPYYQKRVDLFSQYLSRHAAEREAAKQAAVPIKVILPDGTEKQGVKGVTTPLDIANQLSKSLAKKAIVAKVDGQVWDLTRPLEADCGLQIHGFDDPDGKEVGSHCTAQHAFFACVMPSCTSMQCPSCC